MLLIGLALIATAVLMMTCLYLVWALAWGRPGGTFWRSFMLRKELWIVSMMHHDGNWMPMASANTYADAVMLASDAKREDYNHLGYARTYKVERQS